MDDYEINILEIGAEFGQALDRMAKLEQEDLFDMSMILLKHLGKLLEARGLRLRVESEISGGRGR